jgi:hypothetical protein
MTDIINFAEQIELRRVQAGVVDATRRNEAARASLAAGMIDEAECDREIAAVLEQLAKLQRDLDAAIFRWLSMESEHVQAVG